MFLTLLFLPLIFGLKVKKIGQTTEGEGEIVASSPKPKDNQFDKSNVTSIFSSSEPYSGIRSDRSFISSNIRIENCVFLNSFALGDDTMVNSGGAIFIMDSFLFVDSSTFTGCSSYAGGAISSITSDVSIQNTKFTSCTSTYMGGALIVFSTRRTTPEVVCFLDDVVFESCSSQKFYGAATFCNIDSAVLTRVMASNNNAAQLAGAFGFLNTTAALYQCVFIRNQITNNNQMFEEYEDLLQEWSGTKSFTFNTDGGGAIFYAQSSFKKEWNLQVAQFSTDHCCFWGNGRSISGGKDVYVVGPISWRSVSDRFSSTREKSISLDYQTKSFTTYDKESFVDDDMEPKMCEAPKHPSKSNITEEEQFEDFFDNTDEEPEVNPRHRTIMIIFSIFFMCSIITLLIMIYIGCESNSDQCGPNQDDQIAILDEKSSLMCYYIL